MEGEILHTILVSTVLLNRTHTLELRLSEGDIAEIFTRQLSKRSAITEVLRNCIAVDSVQTEAKCILLAVSFPPLVGRLQQCRFGNLPLALGTIRHDRSKYVLLLKLKFGTKICGERQVETSAKKENVA